ncbi:TPA: hypothetical protein O8L60_004606 [Enterobacter cloacae]|nr:hypothetical protein [Enterobacter cloacae]
MQEKIVAIIGGPGGLDRALSQYFAAHNASNKVVGQTFRDEGVKNIAFIKANLSLMSEDRRIAGLLPAESFDMLIFTTVTFAAPARQDTAEGPERDVAVSLLSRMSILRDIGIRLGGANHLSFSIYT